MNPTTTSSTYSASATYRPQIGDSVFTPAGALSIPGVVVAANDPSAPVIAYPHLGLISAHSASAVTLVERGRPIDASDALAETARKMRIG